MSDPGSNVGLGVFFSFLAGLAVVLGNVFTFTQRSTSQSLSHAPLAISLGLAAGVMCYVSLVELFSESVEAFSDEGYDKPKVYTVLCFFCGWIFTASLDLSLHYWTNGKHHAHSHAIPSDHHHVHEHELSEIREKDGEKKKDLDSVPHTNDAHHEESKASEDERRGLMASTENGNLMKRKSLEQPEVDENILAEHEDKDRLRSTTLLTSLSVSLHNLPEGLAVLATTIDEPAVGATLALAVTLHNFPIGVSIALPIFYTTGSRWKAFLVTLCVGATQPLGAMIGYYLLEGIF